MDAPGEPNATEPLRLPSLGDFLRRLRDDRGLSREGLARSAGVSASYISHLEVGLRDHPTRPVVEALIGRLDREHPLTEEERRYVFDLAGLRDLTVPTVEELRTGITPELQHRIDRCAPDPAGYFDSRWNILALNTAATSALPGLAERGHVLHWLFADPRAAAALLDRERVAALCVASLRTRIAWFGETDWAADLLEDLDRYPEFRHLWTEGQVFYASERPTLHLRDLPSPNQYHLDLQLYEVDTGHHPGWTRMFWGIRTR